MDSTSRGGIVLAIKDAFNIPVKLIGLGETINDLVFLILKCMLIVWLLALNLTLNNRLLLISLFDLYKRLLTAKQIACLKLIIFRFIVS